MNRREKFLTCNTLVVIPLMLQGKSVLIDLRNEISVAGRIAHADGLMNINLREVVFIDQKGCQYEFDEFMVPARIIRQIQLPADIDAALAINSYLAKFTVRRKPNDQRGKSLKTKRAVKNHKQILAEICNSKTIMVRNYKKGTRSGEVNEEAMSSAISDVLEHKLSFRKTAAKYGVKAQINYVYTM